MVCFPCVDGVVMLKLPSSKLIKSYFNQPKPLAPVGEPLLTVVPKTTLVPLLPLVPETMLETPLNTKPIDPMYILPGVMDNIASPDESPLLTRSP